MRDDYIKLSTRFIKQSEIVGTKIFPRIRFRVLAGKKTHREPDKQINSNDGKEMVLENNGFEMS